MTLRLAALGLLTLAAALPGAAFADDARRVADVVCDDGAVCRVWIAGHVESRESRRVIPAVVRDEWVPERREVVVVPAVTEEVRVPAVVERRFIPELRERTFVPGRFEVRVDPRGFECRVWIAAHVEDRIVREARCEDVVVRPERIETRIVVPARREVRVVEPAHLRSVVVRAERVEVTRERVWVPGHFEERVARQGD